MILPTIHALVQGVGLAMVAMAIGFFKTKKYKKEFTLFALSGIVLVLLGSCVPN